MALWYTARNKPPLIIIFCFMRTLINRWFCYETFPQKLFLPVRYRRSIVWLTGNFLAAAYTLVYDSDRRHMLYCTLPYFPDTFRLFPLAEMLYRQYGDYHLGIIIRLSVQLLHETAGMGLLSSALQFLRTDLCPIQFSVGTADHSHLSVLPSASPPFPLVTGDAWCMPSPVILILSPQGGRI